MQAGQALRIEDFPLAWRWTNAEYALLPMDVLSSIVPQTPEQAAQLFEESCASRASDRLDEATVALVQTTTRGVPPARISDWLFARHSTAETPVFISWQRALAVSTSWGVFAQYWDDFCYPASDDVSVWSPLHDWMLLYHHEETLQFGHR